MGNIKIKNGWLTASVVGESPYIQTIGDISLLADDIKKIKIKFKNTTQSTKARLYFVNDESSCYCGERGFEINTYPNDTVGAIYEIDQTTNPNWTGTIHGLRFEPAYNEGNIEIDYIRLEK